VPLPGLTLLGVLAALWVGSVYASLTRPYDELINWAIFVTLAAGLFTLLVPALLGARPLERLSSWAASARRRAA
jgi:hypothetical protein